MKIFNFATLCHGGNAMTRSLLASVFAAVVLVWSAAMTNAQQSGTAAEAKAMLDRAVSALKANKAAALREFNDKNNMQFHDRDLYVACYDISDGKLTAHPNPALVGRDVRTVKIKNDRFGQRFFDAARRLPEGNVATVDYEFPRPGTTEPVPKQSFEMRIGDQGCAVGYYK
jgi:Single Cache domain 2